MHRFNRDSSWISPLAAAGMALALGIAAPTSAQADSSASGLLSLAPDACGAPGCGATTATVPYPADIGRLVEVAAKKEMAISLGGSGGSVATYKQAWKLIAAGKLAGARRALASAENSIPPGLKWLVDDGYGWLAFYENDLELAEATFKAVVDRHEGAYMSVKGLAFVAAQRGDFEAAEKLLLKSLRQNPYQVLQSFTVPALKMIEGGEHDRAGRVLELASWVYPKSSDVDFLLARAYAEQGKTQLAADKAIRAVSLAPAYIHPAFDKLKLDPELVRDAYKSMGWGLLATGDAKGAATRYKQYFAAGGSEPSAHRGAGFAHYKLEDYPAAIKHLKVAAGHEPGTLRPIKSKILIPGTETRWPLTYNATSTLGYAFLKAKQPKEAEAIFRKVLATHPDWVDVVTGIGHARWAQGDKKGAEKWYRNALRLQSRYPDAKLALAELKKPKARKAPAKPAPALKKAKPAPARSKSETSKANY